MSTASTMLKIAVFAPMPSATVRTMMAVMTGADRATRSANCTSCTMASRQRDVEPRRTIARLPATQPNRERAPHAERALRGELAAHAACEIAADREPEPRSLHARRVAALHLHEALEHVPQSIRRNPDAGVADLQLDEIVAIGGNRRLDEQTSALVRELR